MRVHVSPSTREALKPFGDYRVRPRGKIEIKGKGQMLTYWLTGKEGYTKPLPRESVVMDSVYISSDTNEPTNMGEMLKELQNKHKESTSSSKLPSIAGSPAKVAETRKVSETQSPNKNINSPKSTPSPSKTINSPKLSPTKKAGSSPQKTVKHH